MSTALTYIAYHEQVLTAKHCRSLLEHQRCSYYNFNKVLILETEERTTHQQRTKEKQGVDLSRVKCSKEHKKQVWTVIACLNTLRQKNMRAALCNKSAFTSSGLHHDTQKGHSLQEHWQKNNDEFHHCNTLISLLGCRVVCRWQEKRMYSKVSHGGKTRGITSPVCDGRWKWTSIHWEKQGLGMLSIRT